MSEVRDCEYAGNCQFIYFLDSMLTRFPLPEALNYFQDVCTKDGEGCLRVSIKRFKEGCLNE